MRILIILFISVALYAQPRGGLATSTQADTTNASLTLIKNKLNEIINLDNAFTTSSDTVFTVTTAATQLVSNSGLYTLYIENKTAGSEVYIGYNSSVSSSRGVTLNYLDGYSDRLSNTNKLYVKSNTTATIYIIKHKR